MALVLADLVATDHLRGVNRLWDYQTPDSLVTVATANYFNGATALLAQNDVIMVRVAATGGEHYIVTSVTGAATVVIVAFS